MGEQMKRNQIQSISYAGIFAAIYMIITLLSVVFPFLEGFILVIMPIFATYYAIHFSCKQTFIFNLVTLILCFLLSYSDPFFAFIYILPTLIVGDIFGFLIKKKIPFFLTFFFLSLTFLLTNLLTLYLTKIIYHLDLFTYLFSNEKKVMSEFAFSFLFIISIVEAILCQIYILGELKKINITLKKENFSASFYSLIGCCSFIFMCIFKCFSANLYYLLFLFSILLSFPSLYCFFQKRKHLSLSIFVIGAFYILTIFPLNLYLNYTYIPIVLMLPILMIEIAIFCQKMYNKKRSIK